MVDSPPVYRILYCLLYLLCYVNGLPSYLLVFYFFVRVFIGSLSFFLVKISYSFQITLMVLNHFVYLLLQLLVKEEKRVD